MGNSSSIPSVGEERVGASGLSTVSEREGVRLCERPGVPGGLTGLGDGDMIATAYQFLEVVSCVDNNLSLYNK